MDRTSPMKPHVALRSVLVAGLTLAYPVVIYAGLRVWSPRELALVLVVLTVLRASMGHRAGWQLAALAAAALAMTGIATDHALPLKLYPALVNLMLLVVFGWSLWHPPTMVERFARMREPDLPPHAVAYTRRVTQVWCGFFIVNGTLALLTACYATEAIWALYNGGIAYVLIGSLFGIEWLVRQRVIARHRGPAQTDDRQ